MCICVYVYVCVCMCVCVCVCVSMFFNTCKRKCTLSHSSNLVLKSVNKLSLAEQLTPKLVLALTVARYTRCRIRVDDLTNRSNGSVLDMSRKALRRLDWAQLDIYT